MQLKLDAQRWRERRGMANLLDALGADEGLTRYVGGAVRDDLLELPVNDIDLATRLKPDEVVERLQNARIKAVPTGIAHGTVTAVSDGQPVEVTSLRRDVSTDGRRATVAFTDDWKEDAARRDFTINALFADPVTGALHDFFGGLDDLRQRRVRFIGDPLQRIAEDHLRILRFFRFHARFGRGLPDAAALDACAARANDLMALSRERIADELLKLLGLPDPAPTVATMLDRGIFAPVMPEVEKPELAALELLISSEAMAEIAPASLRRLSALLPPDPAVAEKIAARLKLSKNARQRLACAAARTFEGGTKALAYRVGKECAVDRLLILGRDDEALALRDWPLPSFPIRGGQLIASGLVPGPVVARTLHIIEQRWVQAGFPSGAELDAIVASVLSGTGGDAPGTP